MISCPEDTSSLPIVSSSMDFKAMGDNIMRMACISEAEELDRKRQVGEPIAIWRDGVISLKPGDPEYDAHVDDLLGRARALESADQWTEVLYEPGAL